MQIKISTNRKTLYRQIGMNMEERAQEFQRRYGTRMQKKEMQQLYKSRQLTNQKLRPPKGSGTTENILSQRRRIAQLKKEVAKHDNPRSEVI